MPHDDEYAYPGKKSPDLETVRAIRDSTGLGMHEVKNLVSEHPGMTLRDYFASQALAGLCAHSGSYGATNGPGDLSERAYQISDAMIEARK